MYGNSAQMRFLTACCQYTLGQSAEDEIVRYVEDASFDRESTLSLAFYHGVLPLVYTTLHRMVHENKLPDNTTIQQFFSKAKSVYGMIVRRNMQMTSELLRIESLLTKEGIDMLALKGPALAQSAYGDITLRSYIDLDILIAPEMLERTISLLKQEGYDEVYTLNSAQFASYRSIAHDVVLMHREKLISLEVHWQLFSGEFMAELGNMALFKNAQEVMIHHTSLRSPAPEEMLVYLCVHGAKHRWERLEWVVDIDRITAMSQPDWDKVLVLAERTRSSKMVLGTLALSNTLLGTPLPNVILEKLREKYMVKLSQQINTYFKMHFGDPLQTKVRTKKISLLQLKLLDGYKNRWRFLSALFKPTPLDFEAFNFPEKLTFLYYVVRPYNIVKRWHKKYI